MCVTWKPSLFPKAVFAGAHQGPELQWKLKPFCLYDVLSTEDPPYPFAGWISFMWMGWGTLNIFMISMA